MNGRPILAFAAATAAVLCLAGPSLHASAQAATDWPTKPVRILTPFPAGAGPKAVLRFVAEKRTKLRGKPAIVESRPGGNSFSRSVR